MAVDPDPTNGTIDVTASATVDDAATGNSKIVSAYYRIDNGSEIAMAATDGGFDEATENVTASIPAATVAALSNGPHTVCVRGKDQAGNTSSYDDAGACVADPVDKEPPLVSNVTVTPSLTNGTIAVYATARVDDATTGNSHIVAAWYSIDGGTVVQMTASDGSFSEATEDVKATIPASVVNALDEGSHTVCVQGKDLAGNLSSFSAGGACATLEIDKTPPEVTINQKSGQADPTNTSPINLKVSFTENVSDFATGDVTLGGTAGAATATVTGSGMTYYVAVSGMTGDGTVIASITSGVAHDAAGNGNDASTSTDNTVVYDKTPPEITCGTADGDWHAGNVSISCTASDATSGLANSADASFSLSTTVGDGVETSTAQTGARDGFRQRGEQCDCRADRKQQDRPEGACPYTDLPGESGHPQLADRGRPLDRHRWRLGCDPGRGRTPGHQLHRVARGKRHGAGRCGEFQHRLMRLHGGLHFRGLLRAGRPTQHDERVEGRPGDPAQVDAQERERGAGDGSGRVTVKAVGNGCALGSATRSGGGVRQRHPRGCRTWARARYQFNWKTPTTYAGSCKSIELVFAAGGVSYTEGPHAFFSFKK